MIAPQDQAMETFFQGCRFILLSGVPSSLGNLAFYKPVRFTARKDNGCFGGCLIWSPDLHLSQSGDNMRMAFYSFGNEMRRMMDKFLDDPDWFQCETDKSAILAMQDLVVDFVPF